ncbi:MAG: glycosyltransferase [Robiginitomaculum sp.]|nr:MAG: glycosyltransferase [Robiginitomaculum sp.]
MGLEDISKQVCRPEPYQAWMWTNIQKRQLNLTKWTILFVASCVILLVFPRTILGIILLFSSTFVILMAVMRLLAILITARDQRKRGQSPEGLQNDGLYNGDLLHSGDPFDNPVQWPRFTVLVPLYREAHMVTNLMKSLSKIDYPLTRLDIVLVTEADDLPTCLAVRRNLRAPFRLFEVPPSQPRTKPKALNAALAAIPESLNGDIITVYDAEDRPHPGQLKQAALALMADPRLAAVQAPLGYYNSRENLLTRLFDLEYAALFHVWNPALAKLGLPFTLGGTSNHIRANVLAAAGGWDASNVTEDADLSFRITAMHNANHPRRIGTITLPTAEEAVSSYTNWTAQRSRWLKGFMQTWRVHMRYYKTAPDGGHFHFASRIKNLFSLQITVGATLLAAYLHVPSLMVMTILYLASLTDAYTLQHPMIIMSVLLGGYAAAILTAMFGAHRAGKLHLIKFSLLMPFYWLLNFIPVLMASREILVAPDYWRKTAHKGEQTTPTPTGKPALDPANAPLI